MFNLTNAYDTVYHWYTQGREQEFLLWHWAKQPRGVHAHQVGQTNDKQFNSWTILSEVKTNFRTAITIPEKSWCKWVFIDLVQNIINLRESLLYLWYLDSGTFLTTMWLGWKKLWRLKRVPRTSKEVFERHRSLFCLIGDLLQVLPDDNVLEIELRYLNNYFSTVQIILPKQGRHKEHTSSHPQWVAQCFTSLFSFSLLQLCKICPLSSLPLPGTCNPSHFYFFTIKKETNQCYKFQDQV